MGDTTLTGTIMKVIKQYMGGAALTEMYIGKVSKISPFRIKLDGSRLPLEKDDVILLEGVDLSVGDNVVMLSVQKGQSYIVLGKVKP